MAQLLKQSALAYQTIFKFMQAHTSSAAPMSLKQIAKDIEVIYPNVVKNTQQIHDALKKYYATKEIRRMREGMAYVWWAVSPGEEFVPDNSFVNERVGSAGSKKELNEFIAKRSPQVDVATTADTPIGYKKPEITITKNKVLIVSEHIKITIEI